MRGRALLALLAAVPGAASALSCLPPDLAADLRNALAEGGTSVLIGTVTHKADYRQDEGDFRFAAAFEGERVMPGGATGPHAGPVTIEGACINGDCGYLSASGVVQILLARDSGAALTIPVEPCAATPLPATQEAVALVLACLSGGPCLSTVER